MCIRDRYEGVTALGMGNIDRDLLSRYSENGVRFLSTRTIGYNHIDLVAAKELGIKVCNAAYPPNGVADFTVMMILMCLRQYKPVSYTHLDMSAMPEKSRGVCTLGEHKVKAKTLDTVSYTHLDVYKRQENISFGSNSGNHNCRHCVCRISAISASDYGAVWKR